MNLVSFSSMIPHHMHFVSIEVAENSPGTEGAHKRFELLASAFWHHGLDVDKTK